MGNCFLGWPLSCSAQRPSCAPVWTSRSVLLSRKPDDFGVVFLRCRITAASCRATICFGDAALMAHSLISCCTNDGEQLENSVHCSISVLDHIILPYYLVLPATSGLGRDFWFTGIWWVMGFRSGFDLCFLCLSLGIGLALCYFVLFLYLGSICEVYE